MNAAVDDDPKSFNKSDSGGLLIPAPGLEPLNTWDVSDSYSARIDRLSVIFTNTPTSCFLLPGERSDRVTVGMPLGLWRAREACWSRMLLPPLLDWEKWQKEQHQRGSIFLHRWESHTSHWLADVLLTLIGWKLLHFYNISLYAFWKSIRTSSLESTILLQ